MGLSIFSRTRPAERFAEPASFFFNRFSIFLVITLLILAGYAGQTVIVVILALVLVSAGVTRFWSRFSLVGVSCERHLSETRVFPGETIELKLRAGNRKLLPLPWLILEDEIPAEFMPGTELPPGARPNSVLLSKSASLLWYSAANWRQTLACNKRGYYPIGPMKVTSGDIFGMYPRSRTTPQIDNIIVYPKIFEIPGLELPAVSPSGEMKADRPIFEDPVRLVGVREYTPHDSLRRVHWKATARHQTLQVKVFEATTALKLAVFLGVDTFDCSTAKKELEFELGISTAASIANYVIGTRNPAGLFVNTKLADSGEAAALMPGNGTDQLVNILELLAKTTPVMTVPFDNFIQQEINGLPWGTTCVFIFSRPSPGFQALIDDLKHTGHRVILYQIGGVKEAESLADSYRIKSADDLESSGAGAGS